MAAPVPIAIVGMGCRLPGGASNPDRLWDMLSKERSGWREVPSDRWNWKSWYNPYPEAKESLPAKSGYFLTEDISEFDAKFFNIPNYEAHAIDPQQRILLMTTYEALEDAGIPVESLKGSDTSVFVSVFERDYDRMGHKDLQQIKRTHITGSGDAILSNRISYCFDLKGASMTLDTGCSGSLVALHQACHSLRLGESRLAIVGGSQLHIHPDLTTVMGSVGLVNPDGKCYAFDSRGQGYGRGEGVATVILKRLDHAIADGDHVHAVIANSGANQDGKTSGMSMPSGEAQAALIKRVYADAGLNPAETLYVEAHGTGTVVGDKEEIGSISQVFCEETGRQSELFVGSIKSNIGHLEASSGLAGLFKAVLILRHGQIPATLNFIKPKPSLKLDERKITIPTKLTPLPNPFSDGPRRVSINSFGYGGTNCHVILESLDTFNTSNGGHVDGISNGTSNGNDCFGGNAHTDGTYSKHTNGHASGEISNGHTNGSTNGKGAVLIKESTSEVTPQLFVVSAATEKALQATANNLKAWLQSSQPDSSTLANLSFTLATHRSQLNWRRSIIASSTQELLKKLDDSVSLKKVATSTPLTFVFSGQGAQWYAMGRELLHSSRVFGRSIARSDEILTNYGCQWSLTEELSRPEAESNLGDAAYSQPATTGLQVALVDLLASLSIKPDAVVGHSSGEIAAAYAASALDHESAILVAYQRGLCSAQAISKSHVRGSMLAVGMGEYDVSPYINATKDGLVTVACVNSPSSTTISGDDAAIDELKKALDRDSIFARKLKVDTAYHSHHMKTVADAYQQSLSGMTHGSTRDEVKFYSSVTAAFKTSGFGPEYWTSNLVSQVKFCQALKLARDETLQAGIGGEAYTFVEIGPHSALAGPARQTLSQESAVSFKHEYLSALVREKHAVQTFLFVAGRLFELGYPVNLSAATDIASPPTKPSMITDLKPYPWDNAKFWHESRLSKAQRFREFPYHDLCGLIDPMSNIHQPRWRYHINIDALPWLKDHIVDDFIIYPGAGYICMAIEALKQLFQLRRTPGTIKKFVLRNVVFVKSIVIQQGDADGGDAEIEVQLVMTSSRTHDSTRWESFTIYSYNADGSWSEHCSGEIALELEAKVDELEGTREADFSEAAARAFLEDAKQNCSVEMAREEFYADMRASGNQWGPTFAILDNVSFGNKKGVTKVVVPDVAANMPYQSLEAHTIHPITLDATHQLMCMMFKKFCLNAPCVPVNSGLIEISADITHKPGDEIIAAMEMIPEGPKSSLSTSWLFQKGEDGELRTVMRWDGGRMRAVGDATLEESDQPYNQEMAHRIKLGVDADFLTQDIFQNILSLLPEEDLVNADLSAQEETGLTTAEKVAISYRVGEQAASIWIRDAVLKIESEAEEITAPHLVKFFTWMKKWCNSDKFVELIGDVKPEDEQGIFDLVIPKVGLEGQLLVRVGKRLPEILTGKLDPLALMLEDQLLNRVYEKGALTGDYKPMSEYLKILTFKKPNLSFLEIGAGTGGATKHLLRTLTTEDGLALDKYTYTDISSGFFEEARTTFKEWEDYMDFKMLDVEHDPTGQGYTAGSYDVIVASNVLHATKNMDVTMAHVRKLLKPGGSLILIENTRKSAGINTIFGTLSGWWVFEDGREDSPLMEPEEWRELLVRNGFDGLHAHHVNMMVSKAVPMRHEIDPLETAPIRIVRGITSDTINTLSEGLCAAITAEGLESDQVSLEDLVEDDDYRKTYVVIDLAEQPLLLEPSSEQFSRVHRLLNSSSNVLWVGIQETEDVVITSFKGMIDGAARVLRRENPSTRIVTMDVQTPVTSSDPDTVVRSIVDIARQAFWPQNEAQRSNEPEFTFRDGRILIPRVQTDKKFLKWVHSGNGANEELQTLPYHQENRSLRLEVETMGLLGSMRFVDHDISAPLKPHELEVKASAYGVNFKDVFLALGQMNPGVYMVGEIAGTVTAVGSDMKHIYSIGDRVAGIGAEPFASKTRVHGYHMHKIPDWMSFTVAATIPTVYMTAYHSLVEVARLEEGESVLIHAASGGVGQAAIQLAQHIGAEVFCTVGSTSKRDLLVERYGIPESHIFSSRSRSFKQGVLRLTNNEGVNVVLNSLAGETLRDSFDCVKLLGTFVEIGKSDIYKGAHLNMANFDKALTFAAIDLVPMSENFPHKIHRKMQKVMELFEQKALYAISPINTYPIGNIEDAFRLIGGRKHTGKVVLEADLDSTVKATPAKAAPLKLRQDGTYVIAGGLGDLGVRIGRFLASHGAGHIMALSRRTPDDETRSKLTAAIEQLGGTLHIVKCDIGSQSQVREAQEYCCQLPPVRGVIHGGMVLRDRPFTLMTLEDWLVPLGPKVHGTINLDRAFATPDLEFFITLSSVATIIGKSGQSNYCAGNGFQDAFAQAHANHPKTQYISINVGAIKDSQSVASVPNREAGLAQNSILLITFTEFFKSLEYSASPHARYDGLEQSILGFTRQSMIDAADEHTLNNSVFSLMPYARQKAGAVKSDKVDVSEALRLAKTVTEAEALITEATLAKFAIFLDRPADEVRVDQSLSNIGLDSLVSIELKNWMVRTFQVALQTSELAGASSILALSSTIAQRSKIISDEVRGLQAEEVQTIELPSSTQNVDDGASHSFHCCRKSKDLPRYPLVDLDEAINDLLNSIGHFSTSDEELATLTEQAHALAAPGSVGRTLYNQLYEKANDPNVESWIADLLTKALHLKRRHAIAPHGNFLGTHPDSRTPHGQAERAAVIAAAAFEFKQKVDTRTVEPAWLGDRPLCQHSWDWLFSAVREPQVGCDKMAKYEDKTFCAVLRRGHVFRVWLRENDSNASYAKLKADFEYILGLGLEEDHWGGILTADERDSWGKNRQDLLSVDPRNAEYFQVVEESAFVVCLDDGSPVTREDRVHQAFIGDSFNRWHDKCIQYIVPANGRSAEIYEHSMIDALTAVDLIAHVHQAIFDHKVDGLSHTNGNGASTPAAVDEFVLHTSPTIDAHIQRLRESYFNATKSRQYVFHEISGFGKSLLIQHGMPIKAITDLIIQLASNLYFGYSPASWEPVSNGQFHRGRVEIVQVVLKSVLRFIEAAKDSDASPAERKSLLLQAAKECNAQVTKTSEGKNFFRLMDVLEVMSQDLVAQGQDVEVPALFSNPVWKRGYPNLIMQTLGDGKAMEDAAFVMINPESLWMNYVVGDDKLSFSIVGPKTGIGKFQDALDRATEIVGEIVKSA